MNEKITCFKAYDVRGQIPNQLNEDIVYRIGRAFVEFIKPKKVIIGRDIRESSQLFSEALAKGLTEGGADVYDIGLCGTEEVYFATFNEKMDGGIMVTASHNPRDYNGLKFVKENSRPISGDTGLQDIRAIAESQNFSAPAKKGSRFELNTDDAFVEHLWRYVDKSRLRPLRIVVNAGNGGAGKIIDLLEPHMPFEFIKVHHEPDGTFPNGIPNPLLIENRTATTEAVLDAGADLGVAWDGDYDRCFLFDEKGQFIEGYYIVGLLAASFLAKSSNTGDAIVHDPRLVYNTVDIVEKLGGKAVQSKSGHAFIKEKMREVNAVYGGEMSAHHYFRDFAYCDSGMIPWLLIAQMVSEEGRPLSAMVADRIARYPSSGEINRQVTDTQATIAKVRENYLPQALKEDLTDGISLEFTDWRFNLRASNTEPLIRLNVESQGDQALMKARTAELLELIGGK